LMWPSAWSAATTPQLSAAGPIPSGGQTMVGPFTWSPTSAGAIALLASASATGDTSNADTITGPIEHWRLVPFDNNLGQRDVAVVAADPCDQMGELAGYIGTLGLPHGLENSLTA